MTGHELLESKVDMHDEVLFGRNGNPGIAHQVKFMWRAHVWVLCGLSGVFGYAVHFVVAKFGI